MRLLRLYIALLLSSTLFYACSDFEETDLSNEAVVLLAPGDCTTNDENSQFFVWEDLTEGNPDLDIEYYKLQIAEPNFSSPLRFVLDSNVNGTSYNIAIDPGKYEWRVRAENASSRSGYTTNRLSIDSIFDLTNATLELIDPLEGQPVYIISSSSKAVDFNWTKVKGADYYTFQVVMGTFSDIKYAYKKQTIQTPYTNVSMFKNEIIDGVRVGAGQYEWKVIATNTKTETSKTTTARFVIDTVGTTQN